jgi:hypothetical protein
MWYEFNSIEAFNSWHDALCLSLGYPKYGKNQGTGEIDITVPPVTAYTDAHSVEDKWICWVDEEYASGLTETLLRLPEKTFD